MHVDGWASGGFAGAGIDGETKEALGRLWMTVGCLVTSGHLCRAGGKIGIEPSLPHQPSCEGLARAAPSGSLRAEPGVTHAVLGVPATGQRSMTSFVVTALGALVGDATVYGPRRRD